MGMCLSCRKVWAAVHIISSIIYVTLGAIQLLAGIFFVISAPSFLLSSCIWAGSWNVLIGISGGILACSGKQTLLKQEVLLYLTCSILLVNVVNFIINEWHLFIREEFWDKNNFMYYARITTTLSTAAVIIAAFLDSQLTFCSLQTKDWDKKGKRGSHEQVVSDIEYIIPRPKKNSNPKNNPNIYNAYAQSWVFDANATITINNEAKSNDISESDTTLNNSPIRKSSQCQITLKKGSITSLDDAVKSYPIVHILDASDDSNSHSQIDNNRKCSMKSFSRTPSPCVLSASSSRLSLSNHSDAPQIYEFLERLTEPSVYKSRLSTAISERDFPSIIASPCKSPGLIDVSPVGEKVQYASLMQELQQQFKSKKQYSPAQSSSATISDKSSIQEFPRTDRKSSDAEFSKELEAALQLIQDLDSPNTTIETPTEACKSILDDPSSFSSHYDNKHSIKLKVRRYSESSETEKKAPLAPERPDMHTFKPTYGKSTSVIILNTDSQSTSGYSSPTHHLQDTPTLSNTSSINSSSNDIGKSLNCSITNTKNSAIISLRQTPDTSNLGKRKSITLVNIGYNDILEEPEQRKPVEQVLHISNLETILDVPKTTGYVLEKAQTIDRSVRNNEFKDNYGSLNRLSLGTTTSLWNIKSLLRTKKKNPPALPPELEGAIFKSESLAYLSDEELLARHERSIQLHRSIEQRIHQLHGHSTESHC